MDCPLLLIYCAGGVPVESVGCDLTGLRCCAFDLGVPTFNRASGYACSYVTLIRPLPLRPGPVAILRSAAVIAPLLPYVPRC